jgi:hypothetical protein
MAKTVPGLVSVAVLLCFCTVALGGDKSASAGTTSTLRTVIASIYGFGKC